MKIKDIFGFSSPKAAKNSDNLTNIVVENVAPQVLSNRKRDIHSEYCVNEMLGRDLVKVLRFNYSKFCCVN